MKHFRIYISGIEPDTFCDEGGHNGLWISSRHLCYYFDNDKNDKLLRKTINSQNTTKKEKLV